MSFIRLVLASFLGIFVALFVIFFILTSSLASLVTTMEEESKNVHIPDNSILKVNLEDPIREHPGNPVYKEVLPIGDKHFGLYEYITAIHNAGYDSRISGLYLAPNVFKSGIVQMKEFRRAIERFKKSGKFVYAYSDNLSQRDYFLKSVADSIFINPMGMLEIKGVGTGLLYMKSFQEKFGVEMQVIRHGKYKSAVEPFISDDISPENKLQIKSYLNDIWDDISEAITSDRKIDRDTLENIATDIEIKTGEDAVTKGLIDGLFFYDEFEDILRKRLDLSADEDIPMVDFNSYTKDLFQQKTLNKSNNTIAVVYAQGEIKQGEPSYDKISQEGMRNTLREVAEDPNVRGIVLRINSPGGDALVSDAIWREIMLAKRKKTVFVSMGDVAASGGYYISCAGDKIFAEKSTITGSIGVFAMLPSIENAAKKIGVSSKYVTTHPHALYSPFVSLNKTQKNHIRAHIDNIYNTFLKRVAEGRNMTISETDKVAQGRIYSGQDALEVRLIDSIGGLDTTIESLAKQLDLPNYKVVSYPKHYEIHNIKDLLKILERDLSSKLLEHIPLLENFTDSPYQRQGTSKNIMIQTIMPFDIQID